MKYKCKFNNVKDGKPDADKLNLILIDTVHSEYRAFGGKVATPLATAKS